MSSTFPESVDFFLRVCGIYVLIFLLFVFNVISVSMPLSVSIEIPYILMAIYYWSIYRPTLMPPILVFIIGLCLDLLSGLPVGLNALIFLIVRQSIVGQRMFLMGQPFMVLWLGYGVVSSASMLLQWGIFGLLQFNWTPIAPVLVMIGAGTLIFPIISAILSLFHKILPDLPGQYSAVK